MVVETGPRPEQKAQAQNKVNEVEAELPRIEASLDFITNKEEHDAAAERLAEHGLLKTREVLGSLMDEITIFASTALFLLGKKKREMGDQDWKTFHVAPGDLDGAVSSMQALERIRERLARIPGIEFGHKELVTDETRRGEFTGFSGQDTSLLAGRFPVEFRTVVDGEIKDVVVPYEFELFYKTRMVSEEDRKHPLTYKGFKFLDPNALLRQYNENLEFEEKTGATKKLAKRRRNIEELRTLRQSDG